jgi:molybdopterin-containing oxidoreductase family membrane subunit
LNQSPPPSPRERSPLIAPGHTLGTITDKISAMVLTRRTSSRWLFCLGLASALVALLLTSVV